MSAAERPTPPPVIVLSPTEMAGDWTAEVRRKLLEQGLGPEAAEKIVAAARAEIGPKGPERPSPWRRILRAMGWAE